MGKYNSCKIYVDSTEMSVRDRPDMFVTSDKQDSELGTNRYRSNRDVRRWALSSAKDRRPQSFCAFQMKFGAQGIENSWSPVSQ